MESALSDSFDIKPALLVRQRSYHVSDGQVACQTQDGTVEWQADLTKTDHAAFVEHKIRGALMWRFDLVTGDQRRSISLTMDAGTAGQDPDRAVFLDLVEAICSALEDAQPGFQAGIGEYGRYRIWWFVLGLLSALCGGGLLLAAVIGGISMDRLAAAALPIGMLVLLGLVLIRSYHPWQALPKVPVTTLGQIVRLWADRKG